MPRLGRLQSPRPQLPAGALSVTSIHETRCRQFVPLVLSLADVTAMHYHIQAKWLAPMQLASGGRGPVNSTAASLGGTVQNGFTMAIVLWFHGECFFHCRTTKSWRQGTRCSSWPVWTLWRQTSPASTLHASCPPSSALRALTTADVSSHADHHADASPTPVHRP